MYVHKIHWSLVLQAITPFELPLAFTSIIISDHASSHARCISLLGQIKDLFQRFLEDLHIVVDERFLLRKPRLLGEADECEISDC